MIRVCVFRGGIFDSFVSFVFNNFEGFVGFIFGGIEFFFDRRVESFGV